LRVVFALLALSAPLQIAQSADAPVAPAPPEVSEGPAQTPVPLESTRNTGFQIRWQTLSAGGGAAAGPSYQLRGSIGQHSASADHPATGPTFSHKGGFWPILRARDAAAIDRVFHDRFESALP
jgi:hypothetical protein